MDNEKLGPVERIINTLIQYSDHMVHNRPGLVVPDARQHIGVRWDQATWIKEGDQKVVYRVSKNGKKQVKTRVGVGLPGTDQVMEGPRVVGHFRKPGLFPEVVTYLYGQISEVFKVDNEFAARWASFAYHNEENRDLKVLLAAFMLVQSRWGEPVKDGDEMFQDVDYRAVGEAMCLLHNKKKGHTFIPKLILRIAEVLEVPGVIEINRKLGFGQTGRSAIMGRFQKVAEKYLRHLEANPKILEKMIKEGHRSGIMELCRKVGFKPETDKFFELLRWKQVQAKDGRRTLAIGKEVKAAESWEGLTERQVCEKILAEKIGYKVLVGKLPKDIGMTPAIMAASIEAGVLSDNDLIILTPTLEELGLLQNGPVLERWKKATEKAENQRAENIKRNVRTEVAKEGLEKAADMAAQKAVEQVTKDFRIYVVVDRSGSMEGAIERAREYCARFVGAFPLDRLHVCVFNTEAKEILIERPTKAGVEMAFRGVHAGGGTQYWTGTDFLLKKRPPKPEEDVLVIYVGDEEDPHPDLIQQVFLAASVHPVAFGLLHVEATGNAPVWAGVPRTCIQQAANLLGIPCFKIDEQIFQDAYAVPRTIRNLIASTPVGKIAGPAPVKRVSLIQQILDTDLLKKPVWA